MKALYFIMTFRYNLIRFSERRLIEMIDGKAMLKSVMARKNIKMGDVTNALGYDTKQKKQIFANWMQYNRMELRRFAEVANVLGCDVVLLDRETGEIYK